MSQTQRSAMIAMSGGVDSSVAALLALNGGYDCVGITMKLFNEASSCCSIEDATEAFLVAQKLGIPFYTLNFIDAFKEFVTDRFVSAYKQGLTPNPCINCNRYLKFGLLRERAIGLSIDYIVTGHYARIEYDKPSGRYLLKKALDSSKDQSYVLYALTQEDLSHTLFPLGGLTKNDVREIAALNNFGNARKRDSQDICFVPDRRYADFIARYTGEAAALGFFYDINGNILGKHKGITNYTIGQRKGLGISYSEPLYVSAINPNDNSVVLSAESGLYKKTAAARDINLIAMPFIKDKLKVKAKLRYGHKEQPAAVWQTDNDTLYIEFEKPQRAITPGQAVVLYDGDLVLGGGTIKKQ